MTGKQIIKKLQELGWVLVRISGSHHIMKKAGVRRPVPVPIHGTEDIGIDLLRKIEKQTVEKLR